jgi:hypothetical protein
MLLTKSLNSFSGCAVDEVNIFHLTGDDDEPLAISRRKLWHQSQPPSPALAECANVPKA